jgi:hypothetical protein
MGIAVLMPRDPPTAAHVAFSPAHQCAELDGNVSVLNVAHIWSLVNKALPVAGVPMIVGPLPFITLLALWHNLLPGNFMRAIRGTLYSNRFMSVVPWVHLEEGHAEQENAHLRRNVMRISRRRGYRHIPPDALLQHRGFLDACDMLWDVE